MEWGEPAASGRRSPKAIEGAVELIDVDTVIVSVGTKSLTYNEFHFAQNHVRILSSIYGVLKPLDAIKEYRSIFMI